MRTGVIHLEEATLRGREENALLNVVEEFAVAALGFEAVGNVFEDVHGLQLGAAGGVDARG